MASDEKSKLYREIVRRVDEDTILDRMAVHGFWPEGQPLPPDPPEETKERAQIEGDLQKLKRESLVVKDPEKALAAEKKRRWEESKKRRKEAKEKREADQKKRAADYAAHAKANVVHLGDGLSQGLEDTQSNTEALIARGLPLLNKSEDVATLLGVNLPVLRWLGYHRKSVALVHYHRYGIPKKTGGIRHISAPKKSLAAAQQKILWLILNKVAPSEHAHGFVKKRSVVSNATPHVGKKVVINLDLKDFFPTITFRRVKGVFRALGYSEHVATVLGLLCTEPTRAKAELGGKVFHVALGERFLPQGACTSPAVTNLLCRKMDKRLSGLAKSAGFSYTRYADDLTFSGDDAKETGRLLKAVRKIISGEGFSEHEKKTRVMGTGRRQEVTGVVVNAKPSVSRDELRTLRAILHNAKRTGLEKQNRGNIPNFEAHLRGRIAYIRMVDQARGQALLQAFEQVSSRRAAL